MTAGFEACIPDFEESRRTRGGRAALHDLSRGKVTAPKTVQFP